MNARKNSENRVTKNGRFKFSGWVFVKESSKHTTMVKEKAYNLSLDNQREVQ